MTRILFAAVALASLAGCSTNYPVNSSASAIPFSVTSDEGAYADPMTAPRQTSEDIRSSGIPGDSGESNTSSAFK